MEKEEFDAIINGLKALYNVHNKCTREDCEEENEIEEECELMNSLSIEYKEFIRWALGCEETVISKCKASKLWKNLHPHIPIPRVFQTEKELDDSLVAICLMMDGYHHFVAEKNKCCG